MEIPFNRRQIIKAATVVGWGAAVKAGGADESSQPAPAAIEGNAIQRENTCAGSIDWQLTRVNVNSGDYRTSSIEGYCSHQSIAAGETLAIYVSTDPARQFTIDIYRMGYYGGTGARLMKTIGPLAGCPQPVPPIGDQRLRECQWTASAEFEIPAEWLSGVYLCKLTTISSADEPYWQSYAIFIVRDSRPARVMFQCSDNTWQAYNRWPLDESLYTHPDGAHTAGVAVSFNRPYGMYCQIFEHPLSMGSGEFLLWEFPLCFWLEQHGFDVTYVSNSDVIDVEFVKRCRTFVSVGHDEYWDLGQYRTIEAAIEQGLNVLWLSGNSVYMVSEFSADSQARARRRITRTASYGPLRDDELAKYGEILGPFPFSGPDERRIIGARSIVPFNGGGDWTCTRPDHWLFANTGLKRGDSVPGLVGWEFHGEPDMERAGLEVVAEGKAWAGGRDVAHWTSTFFPGPRGNFVFNASTIFWAQGLSTPPGHILPWSHYSRPHGPDPRVQQITRNLLEK